MKVSIVRAALLSSISLLVATPAFAQQNQTPPENQADQPAATAAPGTAQVPATPPETASGTQTASAEAGGDIIVTARRREERLQDVPVSVSAFNAATLERANVQQLSDVRLLTPGFTFASEGGKDNIAASLRGIGQIPLGEATPGVVTYVNEVPLPSVGSNVPTYDVSSIQVLKGPQGTLFGRNTLGGAVLISTQQPVYNFQGYVEGTYGRYNYRELQGAINIPIVNDHIALRVAGDFRRQDPRTRALDGGPGFDNVHSDAFRVTLLLQPFDGLTNTTTYEYYKANELAGGLYLLRQNFPFSVFFGPGLGPVLDAQVQRELALQQANPHGSFDDGINGGYANRKAQSVINNTSYHFGDFTLRNIFGYRTNYSNQLINTGAVGSLTLPVAPGVNVPFTLFHAAALIDRRYITDEFQFLGNFHNFNFIVGAFYNDDRPNGPSGSQFTAFSVGGIPAPAITSHVHNENKAVFAQVSYKITNRLTFNVGGRYSWDKVSACGGEGGALGTTYATYSHCLQVAALGLVDGVGTSSNRDSEPSWTIGLDYHVNPNWLLYVVSRRGYRGANVNTPTFETPFTTGGMGCTTPTGVCPDLRIFQHTGVEKLTDVEVGSKLDFDLAGARGRFNIAAFRSDYKNALQFLNAQTLGIPADAPDAPTNGSVGVNIADLTIYGVEIEASVAPTRHLSFSFNGAFTHVDIDRVRASGLAGLPAIASLINTNAPSFAGTVAASWTTPLHPASGDLVLNADLFMTAAFGGQAGEKLPGYDLANARIEWNHIGGTGLDLALFMRNVFNKFYFASPSVLLSTFPVSSVYVGEPRTYGVSARFRF